MRAQREGDPLKPRRKDTETRPANSSRVQEINVCCFTLPVCSTLLRQPEQTSSLLHLHSLSEPKGDFLLREKLFQAMMIPTSSLSFQTIAELPRGAVGLCVACDSSQSEHRVPGEHRVCQAPAGGADQGQQSMPFLTGK